MKSIHPSQVITGSDLLIRWSATGSIASFTELDIISNYSLSVQWQTKPIMPVNKEFEETAKLSLKGTLNFTTLTDRTFNMPEYVWIEIGLLIKELANGDRWIWNRTGKYLVVSDTQNIKSDDMVEHQYSMVSQKTIVPELVLVPAARQVFYQAPSAAGIRAHTSFGSVTFVKIL
ncbi:hypothetical protein [Chamaesiphon sp. VAR_48_metabat_135_sub]|uniref:hypothetical protein n=1 Tax=Chamaesiphon sp. VAR_48_metabat_135_sub TaxID=2964699 RepID=UPI00286BD70C|nr:hypothetical protein [Chamaesiphon sp. VAR_48_metabat_135_sub]